jgi:hypothetical protein
LIGRFTAGFEVAQAHAVVLGPRVVDLSLKAEVRIVASGLLRPLTTLGHLGVADDLPDLRERWSGDVSPPRDDRRQGPASQREIVDFFDQYRSRLPVLIGRQP